MDLNDSGRLPLGRSEWGSMFLERLDYSNRLILCNAFSTTAGWVNRTAVPLAIYAITGSAVDTSLAFAAAHLPAITVGFFSGAIVDRNRPEAVAKITTGCPQCVLV